MKYKKLLRAVSCFVFGLLLLLVGITGVFAEDGDIIDYNDNTEFVEPITDYIEPETEYIEPETEFVEPETEYVEPETEEPETEPEETEPEQTRYIGNIDAEPEETEFVPPTVAKTISEKTYSTNYTAGIISWICVGVGVIVVIAVLISTKASGGKATQRRV